MKLPNESDLPKILADMEPEEDWHQRKTNEVRAVYEEFCKTLNMNLFAESGHYVPDRFYKRAIDRTLNLFRDDSVVSLGSWTPLKRKFANWLTTYRHRPTNAKPIDASLILLSEVRNPVYKQIVINSNAMVIGFHHGNFFHPIYEYHCAFEYAHCDIFICPSEIARENCQNEYLKTPISEYLPVQFKTTKLIRNHRQINPAIPDSVMIIGHPMNGRRYTPIPGDNTYAQYDLELRIIRDFRKAGKKVIYKMHPDRIVYGPHTDEADYLLTKERFEDVWYLAGSFFMGCPSSSCMTFAMQTDRPIYMPHIDSEWSLEFKKYFYRFSWLPARIDKNRIEYEFKIDKREKVLPCIFY